ncbi:hypothetical protein NQ317_010611 [Molorchus minor]|uniref:Uncharacterized protein n=1 Tax=Molorchus minor TaxID=1323400 RepID=A0ABQ9J9D6_9CUCU|nr:hypothetical protein NQ317_010611 [Molorchus minor]
MNLDYAILSSARFTPDKKEVYLLCAVLVPTATLDEKNVMRTPTLVEKNAIFNNPLYTFRTSAEYADEKNRPIT